MEFSVAFPHKHVEYIDQIQTLFFFVNFTSPLSNINHYSAFTSFMS